MPRPVPNGLEGRVGGLVFVNRRGVTQQSIAEVPSNSDLQTNQSRIHVTETFWSEFPSQVTITTTAGTKTMQNVVVSGIPSGATIIAVYALAKFRAIEDTSGTDNALQVDACDSSSVQVKESSSCAYVDGIDLADAMLKAEASSEGPGDVWVGDNDIKAEVTGDGTYNLQWEGADAVGNNLLVHDMFSGLKIVYSVVST